MRLTVIDKFVGPKEVDWPVFPEVRVANIKIAEEWGVRHVLDVDTYVPIVRDNLTYVVLCKESYSSTEEQYRDRALEFAQYILLSNVEQVLSKYIPTHQHRVTSLGPWQSEYQVVTTKYKPQKPHVIKNGPYTFSFSQKVINFLRNG